jgi:hypothetical protein
MADVLVSCQNLLERLGREEQQLRRLGLHAQAEGVRSSIKILLRQSDATKQDTDPQPSEGDAPCVRSS